MGHSAKDNWSSHVGEQIKQDDSMRNCYKDSMCASLGASIEIQWS